MRPTSIIFLCLSVLLIVGGIVTCYIAAEMAADQGIELFETAGGENSNELITLDDKSLNKISLVLKDADVNIYGDAEEPYIELVNYAGSYSFAVSDGILTVDESIGFLQLLNFGEKQVKFGGLRQYLLRRDTEPGQKTVNIYLTGSYQLKQFEIKLDSGNVTVKGMKIRPDFTIKIGTGDLLFEQNKIHSAVTIDIGTGNAVLRETDLLSLEATVKRGDLSYFAHNFAYQTYEITAGGGGEVFVEGESKGETYTSSTPIAFIKVNVTAKDGSVYLGKTDPNAASGESDESEETAAQTEG